MTLDLTLCLCLPVYEVWLPGAIQDPFLQCIQWSDLGEGLSALGFLWWLQVHCWPWKLGRRDLHLPCAGAQEVSSAFFTLSGSRVLPLSCGQVLNLCLSVAWFLPQCGADSALLTLGRGGQRVVDPCW